jgi:hypothetical protein
MGADAGSAAYADVVAIPSAPASGAVAGGAGNVDIAASAGGAGAVTGSAGGQVTATLPEINLPSGIDAAAAAAVPEPSTVALMLAGVFGAGALKRRRTR